MPEVNPFDNDLTWDDRKVQLASFSVVDGKYVKAWWGLLFKLRYFKSCNCIDFGIIARPVEILVYRHGRNILGGNNPNWETCAGEFKKAIGFRNYIDIIVNPIFLKYSD